MAAIASLRTSISNKIPITHATKYDSLEPNASFTSLTRLLLAKLVCAESSVRDAFADSADERALPRFEPFSIARAPGAQYFVAPGKVPTLR
jgi:hypothetical protein